MYSKRPYVDGCKSFYGGEVRCYDGECRDVTSPAIDQPSNERIVIGRMAQMSVDDANAVMQSAKTAWCNGAGTWPSQTANDRIGALENVLMSMKELREPIVHVLSWEIGKSVEESQAEFDRTMTYIRSSIDAYRDLDGNWRSEGGYIAKIRRGPIGIVLNLGPFNYPLNETYAMLIPALLTGNVVIMKIPNTGGLVHMLTIEIFAKHLPAGALNFLSGSGTSLIGPLMTTGEIDVLAFVGGAHAADAIIQQHPHPHRLKLFLQLESKNLAIVLPDADLVTAVKEITVGATHYNGQRCTALKLIFLHTSLVPHFLPKLANAVSDLHWGMPWVPGVKITPLPDPHQPAFLGELVADAVNKGARIVNADRAGGEFFDSIMRPAILYPVTSDMRLWHEEQFGPVIPIAVYEDLSEVMDYITNMPYGQQASVFTSQAESIAGLLDVLVNVVARVNINAQCSRSPDTLPFTGRRSSALGTMSVEGALRELSVEVVVAGRQGESDKVLQGLEAQSRFLQPMNDDDDGDCDGGGSVKGVSEKK